VPRDHGALALRDEREPAFLVVARNLTNELNAPGLIVPLPKAQLTERNAHLGRPAIRVFRRRGFPDGVPRAIVVAARTQLLVPPNAARIHREPERCQVVVVAVERDEEPVGAGEGTITTTKAGAHRSGRVEQSRADVHRRVVVEDPDFGPLGGRDARVRGGWSEPGDGCRATPGDLVEATVDSHFGAGSHCAGNGGGGVVRG